MHFTGTKFLTLDSVVVETQNRLASMEASYLIQCIITQKQSNRINTL